MQFEVDDPPYKIKSESLEEIPRWIMAGQISDPMGDLVKPQFERKTEIYIRCEVHLETSTNLSDKIIVYKLERTY